MAKKDSKKQGVIGTTVEFGKHQIEVVHDISTMYGRVTEHHMALCSTRRLPPPKSVSGESQVVERLTQQLVQNYDHMSPDEKRVERNTTASIVAEYLQKMRSDAEADARGIVIREAIFQEGKDLPHEFLNLPHPPAGYFRDLNVSGDAGLPIVRIQDVMTERMNWYVTQFIVKYPKQDTQIMGLFVQATSQLRGDEPQQGTDVPEGLIESQDSFRQ